MALYPVSNTGFHNDMPLRQSILMKTRFGTRVSRMGSGSFVKINIFKLKYYFFQFVYILHFFESLKSKSTKCKTPKRKLMSFVQRYSFKFWALGTQVPNTRSIKTTTINIIQLQNKIRIVKIKILG